MSKYTKKFTLKERQDYHNAKSKIGATDRNGKFISDFQRGVHHQKAQNIFNIRKKNFSSNNKKNKVYVYGVDMSDDKATSNLLKKQASQNNLSPEISDLKLWWANRLDNKK